MKRDAACFGLAGGVANGRQLDAMIDGIAQQMRQRRIELFENVAVDLGMLARQLQMYVLAKRAPKIAHHARIAGNAIGQRPHAAR